MRTAAICPTCATFLNALCIIYDGDYLSNIDVSPLDSLPIALEKINNNLVPLQGTTAPVISATYIGQLYINTSNSIIYFATAIGPFWKMIVSIPSTGAPIFADNSTALAGGLIIGQLYRTTGEDNLKIVH